MMVVFCDGSGVVVVVVLGDDVFFSLVFSSASFSFVSLSCRVQSCFEYVVSLPFFFFPSLVSGLPYHLISFSGVPSPCFLFCFFLSPPPLTSHLLRSSFVLKGVDESLNARIELKLVCGLLGSVIAPEVRRKMRMHIPVYT